MSCFTDRGTPNAPTTDNQQVNLYHNSDVLPPPPPPSPPPPRSFEKTVNRVDSGGT